MSKNFTHLHVHTEYSLLDGAIRLPDLIHYAKEQQWSSLAVTDHGNIFGAVKFFQMAQKEKIKPILGIEIYLTPDIKVKDIKDKYYHLILLVQNKQGYKNLCKLQALAYQEGFYFKPRIDYAMLEKYHEGLIASTACLGGHIPTLLRKDKFEEAESRITWFKDIFGPDRFFFELHPEQEINQDQTITNKRLFEYSQKFDVPCIAACDAHYLHAQDREAHEILLSIQTKDIMSNPDRYTFGEYRVHLRTTEEMLTAFKHYPEEIIWNTEKIAKQCEFVFEFGRLFFPNSPVPEGQTQESFFEQSSKEGLEELKKKKLIPLDQTEEYEARLREEIDLIKKMGFIGYFLVVSDFIKWAKRQNIPVGPGRGSAAGSLVAWALEITHVDPLKYNLLFERFLNPERVSMPDIDIDFCMNRREEVINYVKDTYGHDCVCQIITFGTMMAKGVIKDVARTMGFPFQDANALTDLIPEQLKITLKEAIEQEPKLQEMIAANPKIKQLFDICFKLEGLTRHASKHAAGVVIAPEPLDQSLPLYIPPKTTDLVTQYAMTELENLGFLKMDFLGLKNLTVIEHTLDEIKKNHGLTIDLDRIPLDDPRVFELASNGQTDAVFQFESDGIKDVLRKLKPDKFEDLIAVNALYRPGPLGAGMVDDYIERRHGRQEVTYVFPELQPVLEETYGVIVYQEQVMKIASAIAGYSLGAADILRRAMGKKKADVMAQQKELFVKGATERGRDGGKAGKLFDLMAYFAGYGFNKSHSTAYAIIAYHTAYLKAHYPYEFMASSVSFETGNPDQFTHYLHVINEMGIPLLLPDVNRSEIEFTASPTGILFGLKGIKNIGQAALTSILEARAKKPFTDLLDFCKRIDLRAANSRVIENLISAGALDGFPGNRAQKTADLEKVMALAQEHKEQALTGQMGLFNFASSRATDSDSNNSSQFFTFSQTPDWSLKDKLAKEKEVAGFYLSSHPLKSYKATKWLRTQTFEQILNSVKEIPANKKAQESAQEPQVSCIGLLQSMREITTRKGDKMAFAQFEDMQTQAELVIFPKLYAKLAGVFDEHDAFIIKGNVDIMSERKCKIKAQELIPLEHVFDNPKLITEATLILPADCDETLLTNISNALPNGSTPLKIQFYENSETLLLNSRKKMTCTLKTLEDIEQLGVKIQLDT
ncbi:MAG: DNA polymerase III subunit alpha [bacterium]